MDAVERINEHFAIVSVSNRVVVMQTGDDGSVQALWPFAEFKNLLIKERIKVGTKCAHLPTNGSCTTTAVATTGWSTCCGSAEQCRPGDYNGWLGFTVVPAAGDWSKNRDHLLRIICGGNQDLYNWVFNWCAALVQYPGRHAFAALVLRGEEGTGKGHFAHLMLGALFHKQQYLHIIGSETLPAASMNICRARCWCSRMKARGAAYRGPLTDSKAW